MCPVSRQVGRISTVTNLKRNAEYELLAYNTTSLLALYCPNVKEIVSPVLLRGAVAQSVERATPGEEVMGSIAAVAARSPLVGSVSV